MDTADETSPPPAPDALHTPTVQELLDQSLRLLKAHGDQLSSAATPHLAEQSARTYVGTASVVEMLWKMKLQKLTAHLQGAAASAL